jgi:hypothetical protein
MPLIVVDPDDLQAALAWLVIGAVAAGFFGAMVFSALVQLARAAAGWVRNTEAWHRHKANEAYRLANAKWFLERVPPTKRERIEQRLVREAYEHGYIADAIAAQKRAKREAKASAS